MASPRLETYCCPNRDAATQLVMDFQPQVFCGVCIGSASVSLILTILQLLPKKGQSPRKMPKASSSSTILLLISICDILGGLGEYQLDVLAIAITDSFCSEVPQINEADEWTAELSEGSMLFVFTGRFGLRSGNYGSLERKFLFNSYTVKVKNLNKIYTKISALKQIKI